MNTAAIGRRAWQLYRVLVTLIAVACVVQIFLAGRGVFGIRGDASLDDQSSLDPHRVLGNAISVAALVAFILVLVIWDRRLLLWTLVMALLQYKKRVPYARRRPRPAGDGGCEQRVGRRLPRDQRAGGVRDLGDARPPGLAPPGRGRTGRLRILRLEIGAKDT